MFNYREEEVDHALSNELDEVRTLPLTPPKGGSKSESVVFVNEIQVRSMKSATMFLCVVSGCRRRKKPKKRNDIRVNRGCAKSRIRGDEPPEATFMNLAHR